MVLMQSFVFKWLTIPSIILAKERYILVALQQMHRFRFCRDFYSFAHKQEEKERKKRGKNEREKKEGRKGDR